MALRSRNLFDRLREMKPQHFLNDDNFMLVCDYSKVLHKSELERVLKAASLRLNVKPSMITSHSLRAGGCTAMLDAGEPDWKVMMRGRWKSMCWKQYNWPTRSRVGNLGQRKVSAIGDLFAYSMGAAVSQG